MITSKKIVITGQFGVGKSSLFNRFITNTFNEKYLTTIGVRVDKKVIRLKQAEITLMLWDLAGEISQEKVPRQYFAGAHGIIYVFDLSRPSTYARIKEDMEHIERVMPDALIYKIGNKRDLADEAAINRAMAEAAPQALTSAKTGENVIELFTEMAARLAGIDVE